MRVDVRCSLDRLEIENLNCFAHLAVSFHERLTVLVAPNGGGKTTVLDAAAAALRPFVDIIQDRRQSAGIATSDIRRVLSPQGTMEPVTPSQVEASAHLLGVQTDWARERGSARLSKTTTAESYSLWSLAGHLSIQNIEWAEGRLPSPPVFPLIAYYGTGRLWSTHSLTEAKKAREPAPNARSKGYTDCLSPSSSYKAFADWFRRFSYEATNERSPHTPQRFLLAVRLTVDIVLKITEWHTLEWDFAEDTIVAHHPREGRLPVDFLSDGIRTMIGMVADLAHRAVRLNPQWDENAPFNTPGIVLIDEVDLHLHPEWQQVVLAGLQDAFPLIQGCALVKPASSLARQIRHCSTSWPAGPRPRGSRPLVELQHGQEPRELTKYRRNRAAQGLRRRGADSQ